MNGIVKNISRRISSPFLLTMLIVFLSCKDSDTEPTPSVPAFTITIDPTTTHQTMVGFGGALTWYSNLMTSSAQKNDIANLIFSDLGIDIIRFKNWYYPDGYPTTTSTDVMSDDNSKAMWSVTDQLCDMAKERNPNVKTLLSSWGPPRGLKSNDNSREGTLKKNGDGFMYDEYAQYWVDVLDHLQFNPDYISIQNEPTYLDSRWTTCKWAATESLDVPDYLIAFDKVYDRIKDRSNPPVMIGPESQDIPTFSDFANKLKDRTHCSMLAYHPYNINAGTSADQINNSLGIVGSFTTKPNLMTEFSDNINNWFATATFIQNTLTRANSSGYIYWKLIWQTPTSGTDAAMVSVAAGGNYTVTPFYYVMKHYAKYIDAGYIRVNAAASNPNLNISAFKSADGNKLTLVVINSSATSTVRVKFVATGETIGNTIVFQSKEGSYYQSANPIEEGVFILPVQSISTVALDI